MNNSSLYTKTITMSMVKGTGLEMPTIQHYEFSAHDVERARKFYKEVFGWEMEKWGNPENPKITGLLRQKMRMGTKD
jgi:predicted enzyme related to lactoylglutathione lyase